MKKLYTIFIIASIGMMISGASNAQGIIHSYLPISGNKLSFVHFELNNIGKIVGITEYEPTVHPVAVPITRKEKAETINITPGALSSILTSNQKKTITSLQLYGGIDARDFKTMRDSMPELAFVSIGNTYIAEYTGTAGTAGIQNTIYPADAIPPKAFFLDVNLITIILPSYLVSIGDNAFHNCGLYSLTIPNTVVSIGNSAFESCWNLTGTISLPNSVTTIGVDVFADCQNFTGLTLSTSLTSISDGAFNGDWSLNGNLTIPNSVTSIGKYAFGYCYLTGVNIPNSVTLIDVGAFEKCKFLTGTLIIPNSITSISDYTFSLCARLTTIMLPNSVTSIGNYAFTMSGLTSFSIPNSVVSIGDAAFALTGLTSISIPTSVTSLGNGAFDCPGLSSVYANSPIPIIIKDTAGVFYNETTCVLYVPFGSKTLYQVAYEWKNFFNIVEMSPNGLNELADNENIVLYPNPVTDGCYINARQYPAVVGLYNLSGVLLILKQVTNKSYLNLTGLSQGQYIVKINTSKGVAERKIIMK